MGHLFRPGLELTENGWRLTVVERTANPRGVLYGGMAVAASMIAAEAETERPTRWATTRFLRGPQQGDVIDLSVSVDVTGHRTSHVRVVGTSHDGPAFDTVLVCGSGRAGSEAGQWSTVPDAPRPAEIETIALPDGFRASAVGLFERKPVYGFLPGQRGEAGDGRIVFWARIPGEDNASRPVLAWIADCVPLAISAAFGAMPLGASLDNTIRFAASAATEWVLVEVQADDLTEGYGHGTVRMWSEDGTLLASAAQIATMKLLPFPDLS